MDKKRILVTGFEAFGGETVNPSALILDALKDNNMKEMASLSNDIEIHTQLLPVARYDSVHKARQVIEQLQPDTVLMLGLGEGRSEICFEKVAINLDDYRIPDHLGNQPLGEPVIAGVPTAYFTRLPVKAMARTLSDAGIPATVSYSAGTFVGNHLFYGVSHLLATESVFSHVRADFMHLPLLPKQAEGTDRPYMPLDTMVEGILWAIYAALEYQEEISLPAGSAC